MKFTIVAFVAILATASALATPNAAEDVQALDENVAARCLKRNGE